MPRHRIKSIVVSNSPQKNKSWMHEIHVNQEEQGFGLREGMNPAAEVKKSPVLGDNVSEEEPIVNLEDVDDITEKATGGTQAPNANDPGNTPDASLASDPIAFNDSIPTSESTVKASMSFSGRCCGKKPLCLLKNSARYAMITVMCGSS